MEEVEFKKMELKKEILKAIDLLGYKNLTRVQKETIPYVLKKQDLVVKSETGERVIIVMGAIYVIKSRVSGTLIQYNSCIA